MIKNKFILLIAVILGLVNPVSVQAASNNSDVVNKVEQMDIDISLSSEKTFFDLANLKPGDTVTKMVAIHNNGKEKLAYSFSKRFLNGSQSLYENLELIVKDEKNTLFEGRISKFKKLDPRTIKKGDSDSLSIKLLIPYELGNEFQGIGCEFQMKFYVEGTLNGLLPVNGPKLPSTATNIFNLIAVGAILILSGWAYIFLQQKKTFNPKSF